MGLCVVVIRIDEKGFCSPLRRKEEAFFVNGKYATIYIIFFDFDLF